MSEKRLIVNRADDRVKQMTDFSHPIIKSYAQKCNADFKVLSHKADIQTDSKVDDWITVFRTMEIYNLFDQYDRILHLDSDVLIHPKSPNIFDVVPEDQVGVLFEDRGSRRPHRLECLANAQKQFGDIEWTRGYPNSGVLLASKQHRNIFTKINGQYYTEWGGCDVMHGYNIKKHGYEVFELSYNWNHMSMFSEEWNGCANKFKSYIIHYAGPQTGKLNKMKEDWPIFKGSY